MLSTQLKSVLADSVLVSRNTECTLILEDNEGMKLEITRMPSDVTVVKMNRVRHLPGVKDGVVRWICDYLLVNDLDGTDQAILVELKTTLQESTKGREQLRRSLPILKYLNSACQIHSDEPKIRGRTLGIRYFLIGMKNSRKLDKQPVKPRRRVQKENYKDIDVHTYLGGRISFNLLRNTVPD